MGFVLASPAAVFAVDTLDETEEEDVFFAANGCSGPGGCGHHTPARPTTPTPSNPNNINNPDEVQVQPQQTPTKGSGCGGMVLSQADVRVEAAKRAQLI